MKFKRLIVLPILLFALTACSPSEKDNTDEQLSVSEERQTYYNGLIDEAMNSFYWRYDSDTIEYSEGIVPEDEDILSCSAKSGYDMSSHKGRSCIIATANLMFFNKETAGTVYFYFNGNDIIGMYYISKPSAVPCDIHVRNAYIVQSSFSKTETDMEAAAYTSKSGIRIVPEGIFDSITTDGLSYSIMTNGYKLMINKSDSTSPINIIKEIDYSSDGLLPISAAFINDSAEMAVLYGTEAYSEDSSSSIVVPQRLTVFDSDFNEIESEISIDDSDSYSIGFDDGYLLVARSRSIDFYPIE